MTVQRRPAVAVRLALRLLWKEYRPYDINYIALLTCIVAAGKLVFILFCFLQKKNTPFSRGAPSKSSTCVWCTHIEIVPVAPDITSDRPCNLPRFFRAPASLFAINRKRGTIYFWDCLFSIIRNTKKERKTRQPLLLLAGQRCCLFSCVRHQ